MRPCIRPLLLALLLLSSGCERSTDPGDDIRALSGVYIVNEGAFTAGNAELSFLNRETWEIRGAVFASSNEGMTLGDVANHAVEYDGRLYIAVNNSGYIQIVDAATAVSVDRIVTSGPPRQICVVSAQKAFVTLMDTSVAVLDLIAGTEVGRITTGSFPEGIVLSRGKLFVFNSGFGNGNTVSVIDAQTHVLLTNITTPDGPTFGVVGSSGTVFVVCTGAWDFTGGGGETNGSVLAIDPDAMSIIDTLSFEGHPGKLTIGPDDEIYLLGPGTFPSTPAWIVDTKQGLQVRTSSFVAGAYYGIGFDAIRKELYLSTSGDFVTNGSVVVVGESGAILRELTDGIGIAPNGFVFRYAPVQ